MLAQPVRKKGTDVEKVQTEVVEEVKPKRRRRRTKAEIEADKARKEAENAAKQDKEAASTADNVEALEPVDTSKTSEHSTDNTGPFDVLSSIDVSSAPVKPVQEVDVVSVLEEVQPCVAVNVVGKHFVGNAKVYEAPVEGAYFKNLYSAFECLCELNGFVQVQYMKPGFGLVKGYVSRDDVVNNLS